MWPDQFVFQKVSEGWDGDAMGWWQYCDTAVDYAAVDFFGEKMDSHNMLHVHYMYTKVWKD